MTRTQLVPTSIRIGEVVFLLLCFALPTLAVFARIYTKVRLLKDMRLEDSKSLYPMEDTCSINRTSAVGSTSGPTSLSISTLGLALRSHLILGDSMDLYNKV